MGADVKYFRMGVSIPPDIRENLQGGGKFNPHIWCRDMGDVPLGWEDTGRFPPQVGPLAGEDTAK